MSDAVVIICTRKESSRLPGKALRKIAGVPAIKHILNRLKPTGLPVVLATPIGQQEFNEFIEDVLCIHCGNAKSPLHRMAEAINLFERYKYVVRITHDDILIDSKTVLELLDRVRKTGAGYGRTPEILEGAGVEVIAVENLLHAAEKRKENTEFISYFVKGEGLPLPGIVHYRPRSSICRNYRLTMDYQEDANLLEAVLRHCGPNASVDQICAYLDAHPYLLNLNKQPELSFYTCAYNAEEWIEETILSVLNSGVPNFEYVIVEDGSTDETLQKIAKYANDPRVRLIVNQENLGLASSSNIAIDKSKGSMVMRVDADDLLIADQFAKSYTQLKDLMLNKDAGIIYPAYRSINEFNGTINNFVDPRHAHHAGCAVMDKRVLNEIRFRDGLRHWDGLDLHKRIKATGKAISYFDEPLWMYRQRDGSMSRDNGDERASLKLKIEGGKIV